MSDRKSACRPALKLALVCHTLVDKSEDRGLAGADQTHIALRSMYVIQGATDATPLRVP